MTAQVNVAPVRRGIAFLDGHRSWMTITD